MSEDLWRDVDAYFEEQLVGRDAALAAALADSAAAGLPDHHVSATQGKLLFLLARLCRARTVLEIGTLGGFSTIWLARALPEAGRVITLERNPDYAAVARANLARAGVASRVELRIGDAAGTLRALNEADTPVVEAFDLFFLDADKPSNPAYLDLILPLARPGSLIVADNVVRGGAVTDATSPDPRVQGIRRFVEQVAADPRLEATAVPTVGRKGFDGFVLALVTDPSEGGAEPRRDG